MIKEWRGLFETAERLRGEEDRDAAIRFIGSEMRNLVNPPTEDRVVATMYPMMRVIYVSLRESFEEWLESSAPEEAVWLFLDSWLAENPRLAAPSISEENRAEASHYAQEVLR